MLLCTVNMARTLRDMYAHELATKYSVIDSVHEQIDTHTPTCFSTAIDSLTIHSTSSVNTAITPADTFDVYLATISLEPHINTRQIQEFKECVTHELSLMELKML